MSLTSENMLVLMAYADGELEGDERLAAEKLLATEPDAVRFVEQVAGLGDLVELGHEDRSAETIAKFDVADSVMSRITLTKDVKPAATEKPKVASLAEARDARERRGKAPTAKEQRGSNIKIGAGIAAALALAASVFVFAQHRTEETPMAKAPSAPAAQATQVVAQGTGTPAPATTVGGAGVEVSTENSPSNSVSVFYLPSANELSTSVVVWVDETGEK